MRPARDGRGGRSTRDRILQVRIPPELQELVDAYLTRLQESDPRATQSQAVRVLLRDALGRGGLSTDDTAAGFNEGVRRGYSEARSALRSAFKKLFEEDQQ
jgi:hypothetical protein